MGKFLVRTIGLFAVAGAGIVFRHQLEPFVAAVVPAPYLHEVARYLGPPIESIESQLKAVLPSQLTAAFAGHNTASHGTDKAPIPAGTSGHDGKREVAQNAPPAKNAKGGPPPAPVSVTVAQTADMPVILSSPGTVEPMATVIIKPRVDGQIIEVNFKEGDLVTAGSVMFRLDDRLIVAQIKQAEAAVARDRASLKDAESILDRKETLLRNKYASEQQTETARQQVEVLKASIAAGLAAVEAQKTQLDYLTIRAPITGRTGTINSKLGSFVRSADPSANPVVTINQTKPIAVSFALPQFNLDALRAAVTNKAVAVVTVPGVKPLKVKGTLFFVDNQVDKTTGTLTGKVMVPNEDETLWPGQAVGIDLTVEIKKEMVAVIAAGVLPAQQGMIAWVVGPDNTVSIRNVKQERVIDQIAYISEGLKAGERVVVDGQLRLGPGGRVTVQETKQTVPVRPESMDGSGTTAPQQAPGGPDAADPARKS